MQKLPEDSFLEIIKVIASSQGYNPLMLQLSKDKKHKLEYNYNNNWIKFGAKHYNDFPTYIYNHFLGNIPFEKAIEKKTNYRKRAKSIMLKTNNKYSPASLSYSLLWN